MSDRLFKAIIAAVTILGMLSVVALVVYTYYLHEDCSIISYIANGR